MKSHENKIYCSLDIETTGFDPLKEEVLEVGFAFFEVKNNKLKITEEWTQVFKPNKEVSPQILGLTGITKEEIESAPTFAEHREFIQNKLGNAVIVGHNINFDTKFLEAFGIKFSGEYIDTLDLVQWLLPTHHSYNLENLMHTFGISHKEAHRALADSKATLVVMEKLLGIFSSFPKTLQEKIRKFVKPFGFLWAEFLNYEYATASLEVKGKVNIPRKNLKDSFVFSDKHFYNFSLEDDTIKQAASLISSKKTLLVVPQAYSVLDLYKNKLVDAAAFLPEHQFDEKKFSALLKSKTLTSEQARFVLKVLVWQATNWQTDCLLDLNLSFFGGQFKTLISGGKVKISPSKKTACDMATFFYMADQGLCPEFHAVIAGLSEFENAITSGMSTKVSWGYFNYLIKSYYNPELKSGEEKFKTAVENSLLASDLFFGLISALLRTEGQTFEYFKINANLDNDERWNKVKAAAESFEQKIVEENKILQSFEVEKFLKQLKSFFASEQNRVKWIELADSRCVLFSMPLDISNLVKEVLCKFAKTTFVDSLDEEVLPKFFLNRLGLKDYQSKKFAQVSPKQGDLFSSLKKVFGKKSGVKFHYKEVVATEKEILSIIKNGKPWPAAVLFASPVQVKEFYENNYQDLKQEVALLAQAAYGGSNKIIRNFSINKNSLMLVADKFILKSINQVSPAQQVTKIAAKTLVLCRLPFDQFTHPYQEAVSASLSNAFEGYALPKALYNFHCLIKLFYTPDLEDIYVIDAKLSKPYAKVFKEYWKILIKAKNIS